MKLSKREQQLWEEISLEEYKASILREAKKHLTDRGVNDLCLDCLRRITKKSDFNEAVEEVVNDSMYYFR